jgi:hypothetical protein
MRGGCSLVAQNCIQPWQIEPLNLTGAARVASGVVAQASRRVQVRVAQTWRFIPQKLSLYTAKSAVKIRKYQTLRQKREPLSHVTFD